MRRHRALVSPNPGWPRRVMREQKVLIKAKGGTKGQTDTAVLWQDKDHAESWKSVDSAMRKDAKHPTS